MSRLVIRNRSQYPTDEVKRLIRFAVKPLDMRAVCIHVKNANNCPYRGLAYRGIPGPAVESLQGVPPSSDWLVTMAIGAEDQFPHEFQYMKRGPIITTDNWKEAVVTLAAHEGLHIEQFKENKPMSEIACEWFSQRMLDEYRLAEDRGRVDHVGDVVATG